MFVQPLVKAFYYFIAYLHEEQTDDKAGALTVADLPVVNAVGLHDVEQALLAESVLLLEEVVLGVSPSDVPSDDPLASRGALYVVRELLLHWRVVGAAQQLPYYASAILKIRRLRL